MQKRLVIASLCVFAVIVGIAQPAQAQPRCACKQQMGKQVDELGGATTSPRGGNSSASSAAKALDPTSTRNAAPPSTRRSLEIELNFFGRKYSVEFITTSELDPAKVERSLPPARPAPASTPPALG
jgi:hypothetical protein